MSEQSFSKGKEFRTIAPKKYTKESGRLFSNLQGISKNFREGMRQIFTPALSREEKSQLVGAEREIREHLIGKLERYGIPLEKLRYLPRLRYVKNHPDFQGAHEINAYTDRITLSINKKERDMLNNALILAHESSHWYSSDGLQSAPFSRKPMGGALENGFAIFDQVDLYPKLARLFPNEAEKRNSIVSAIVSNEGVKARLETAVDPLYSPIDIEKLSPFIEVPFSETNLQNHDIHIFLLRSFRFAEELCRTIGYKSVSEEERKNLTPEILLQKGRTLLERDRYTKETKGRDFMKQIFGDNNYMRIMKATDQNDGSLDEAMRVVRQKQEELGINHNFLAINE